MLFPYTYGTNFVRTVLVKRGKQAAFAGVFERPPLNTREIMEPAVYLAAEPQVQLKVLPLEKVLGSGWERGDFSGLGEADLHIIVRQWASKEVATKFAREWRGGYYMALTNKKAPKDVPLPFALVLGFSSPAAANQFASIYQTGLAQRYKSVQPATTSNQWTTDQGTMRLYVASSTVIALESFTPEEAAKLYAALAPALAPVIATQAAIKVAQ
jgi:hypothetical protein